LNCAVFFELLINFSKDSIFGLKPLCCQSLSVPKSATSTCVNCSRYTCEVIRQAMTNFCETDLQNCGLTAKRDGYLFASLHRAHLVRGASDPGLTIQRLQYRPASSESCSVMYSSKLGCCCVSAKSLSVIKWIGLQLTTTAHKGDMLQKRGFAGAHTDNQLVGF